VIGIDLVGKLIVFEGLDASGKSTQARRLAGHLQRAGLDVVTTREPGGTPIAEGVRRVLLEKQHEALLPFSELLLFMVSRAQNTQEVILPALQAGKTVVASRYRLSSLAYQGYGRGLDLDLIRQLNEAATAGTAADHTLLIDVPAEYTLRRKADRGDRIEVESIEFHRRVRQGFLELTAGDPTVHVVDGTGSIAEIGGAVAQHLGLQPFARSTSGGVS
jgi:dTMP kinase